MATLFTPGLGALGGALIGGAAALLLLTNGRVAGMIAQRLTAKRAI